MKAHTRTHTHSHTHPSTYVHTHTHALSLSHTHTHTHTRVCTHAHTLVCAHTLTHIYFVHVFKPKPRSYTHYNTQPHVFSHTLFFGTRLTQPQTPISKLSLFPRTPDAANGTDIPAETHSVSVKTKARREIGGVLRTDGRRCNFVRRPDHSLTSWLRRCKYGTRLCGCGC